MDKDQEWEIAEVFHRYDANGDGFISHSELAQVLRCILPWSDGVVDALISEGDKTGSGQIAYEEFIAWLGASPQREDGKDGCGALEYVRLRMGTAEPRRALDALSFSCLLHGAYATTKVLTEDCDVEFHGPSSEDVLVKVYELNSQFSPEESEQYELVGHIHTVRQVRTPVRVQAGCYLGISICKDFGECLRWKMEQLKCSPRVSWTTEDCVGDGERLDTRSVLGVYLGKHGFGQPAGKCAWFGEFSSSASRTLFGALVPMLTQEYVLSAAARVELGRIPQAMLHVYVRQLRRVVRWDELQEDGDVLLAALGSRCMDGSMGLAGESDAFTRRLAAFAGHEVHEARLTLPFHELVLDLAEYEHGAGDPAVAGALNRLALTHMRLGRFLTMKTMLERALKILQKQYGPEHVEVARILGNLAHACGLLGNLQMQKGLLQSAVEIMDKHYGTAHVEVAGLLANLALVHGRCGEPQAKIEMLERALGMMEEHYGTDHIALASTLINLANASGELKDLRAKADMLQRALSITEEHLGKSHIRVANILSTLADAHGSLGNRLARRDMLQRALKIKEAHHGMEHLEVMRTLSCLAAAHGDLGDRLAMREALNRASAIADIQHESQHPAAIVGGIAFAEQASLIHEKHHHW